MSRMLQAAISEVTESVKALGVRDWLIVFYSIAVIAMLWFGVRQNNLLIAVHDAATRPMIESSERHNTETGKIVIFQFVECLRNAKDTVQRDRCEQAMNGIRPWR